MSSKKSHRSFLSLVFLPIILIFIGLLWWTISNQPVDKNKKTSQIFVIRKGESTDQIAQNLKKASLVRNPLAFKLKAYQLGLLKKIQAGDYHLLSSMDLSQIAQTLSHGTLDQWITIPEGWRAEEIIFYLQENFFSQPLSEADKKLFLENEGFLFPDTYLIPKKATTQNILTIFKKNFDQRFDQNLEKDAQKQNLSKHQILTLASLVEREAKHDQDRPLIAGILLKRLEENMPLQVDATLQYVVANQKCQDSDEKCNWWSKPKPEDKPIRSPYNTYLNKDLPPAPICNPGLSSIKAVIYPQDSEYWYYLSDREGNTHYSKTLEEHQENINQFLSQD
jgi:UPF0755 protein